MIPSNQVIDMHRVPNGDETWTVDAVRGRADDPHHYQFDVCCDNIFAALGYAMYRAALDGGMVVAINPKD